MDLKRTPLGQTIVKPTALGPVANTDTKLLIYGLFQKGRVLAQDGVGGVRVLPVELKAAVVLFYSLLDEKQRRLYAGVEAMKLGHGGDQQIAELLGMDPSTVARGRRELLMRDVELDGVRRKGGGRRAVQKKKNARSHRQDRRTHEARHRGRSDDGSEMDAADHRQDCLRAKGRRQNKFPFSRHALRITTKPFAEYRETSSVGRVLPWFADGPLLASSPRRKSSGVSKAIAIWALSFTRLEANRNLLTAMSLLPKSIHRCRRYPTKFNSGRDIPP